MKLKSTVRTMEVPKGKVIGHLSDEDRQAIFMGMTFSERFTWGLEMCSFFQSVRGSARKEGGSSGDIRESHTATK